MKMTESAQGTPVPEQLPCGHDRDNWTPYGPLDTEGYPWVQPGECLYCYALVDLVYYRTSRQWRLMD